MIRWLVWFWIGFTCSGLYAQTAVTKRYTTEDGLIANDVTALLFDSQGILWIGSRAGLSVRQQGEISIDEEALQHRFTNITTLVEDDQQGVWIGSYGQGILYKGKKRTLLINSEVGLFSTRVNSLFISGTKLYIGTSEGISILDIQTQTVEKKGAKNTLATPSAVSSFYKIASTLFATTINHGVFKIESDKVIPVGEEKEVVASFFDSKRQELLLGLKFELEIHKQQTNQTEIKKEIKGTRFFQQVEDKVYGVGADILNGGGGIYAWDGKQLEKLNKKYGIHTEELYSLAYDTNHKLLYVGSKKQGLFQVDLASPLRFDSRFGSIEAIQTHANRVYVFGEKGLSILQDNQIIQHVDKTLFKAYQVNHKQPFIGLTTRKNHFFEIEHSISSDQIQFYKAVSNRNSIWVSTNLGLFQLTPDGQLEKYVGIHTYQYDFFQGTLLETDPYGGVRVYSTISPFQYEYLDREQGSFVPRDIVDMQEVNGKMYLAGALDGLYVYEKKQFRSLLAEGIFTENRLKFIEKGADNYLYIATDFGDIYKVDVAPQQPKVIQKIPQKKIVGHGITFLHSSKQQLFVGTNKGITVFDDEGTFLFNTEQGLDTYNIKSSALIGNHLLLGTDMGLYTLDIQYFKPQQMEYHLVLSAIKINGLKRDIKPIHAEDYPALELPYDENSIYVNFVLLGAKYAGKLKFQYRVKPTEEWLDLEQNTLALNYLNAGEYPIEIKISDYDKGTEQIKSLLNVTILPPFYYSWWFFSLVGLVGIGVVAVVFQRIKRQQDSKAKQLLYEKKVAELKLLSVRSQLNTHFIFNVLSSFQYFIIAHKEEEALYYLERFASLIRKTLNLSLVEQVSLKDEINYLQGYFELENMRLDGRVQFELDLGKQLNLNQIRIPPLLLQPFIENSLIHAFPENIENPTLTLKVYSLDNDVILEVIDNGIGDQQKIKQYPNHEAKGLFLVKERMKMIQDYLEEHISIHATESGTKVRLVLKNALH